MKSYYEDRFRFYLLRRTPVIIRLDGRAFHNLASQCVKPFDGRLSQTMVDAAVDVLNATQGSKCAYVASDEISVLLIDFGRLTTEAHFDYNIQKLCSVTASLASSKFTESLGVRGIFDCRVFNIPREEVSNYFIWRQLDWARNSVHMLARSLYPHEELLNKKLAELHEMIYRKGVNWADVPWVWKNGTYIEYNARPKARKWEIFTDVIFTADRGVIEKHLLPKQEQNRY